MASIALNAPVRRRRIITTAAAIGLGGLGLTAAAPASAGTLSRSGGELVYTAAAGNRDFVEYGIESGKLRLDITADDVNGDPVAIANNAPGCTHHMSFGEEWFLCDLPTSIRANLGSHADSWSNAFDQETITIPMTINGEAGEDYIATAAGADTIDAGPATAAETVFDQQVYGRAGNDVITNPAETSANVDGDEGNDRITVTGDDYLVSGGDGDDTITVSGAGTAGGGFNLAFGDAGTDTLTGGPGEDDLYGGDGDDTLFGLGGTDDLYGEAGLYAAPGNDTLHGGAGDDDLDGGLANDRLYGEDGNDDLHGETDSEAGGNDLLDGGAGDDTLDSSLGIGSFPNHGGADTYVGGPGSDELDFYWASGPVTIRLNGAPDDGRAGEGDNVGSDIEKFGGSSGNDIFVGDDGAQEFEGYGGEDDIEGQGGPDFLSGGDFEDIVDGGAGNDVIGGGTLSDNLIGGPGADSIVADPVCSQYGPNCFAGDFDEIDVRDGERDEVFCHGPNGPEVPADSVIADSLDVVPTSGSGACRDVQREDVQPNEFVRNLTISYVQKRKGFGGRVRTAVAGCKASVVVKVFRKKKGPDAKVGKDRTSATGAWFVGEPGAKGTFYAKVGAKTIPDGLCLPKKSREIKVG